MNRLIGRRIYINLNQKKRCSGKFLIYEENSQPAMIHVRSIINYRRIDVYFHDKIERYVSPLKNNMPSDDIVSETDDEISFHTNVDNMEMSEDIRKSVNVALTHKDHGTTIIFACINNKIVGVYCFCDLGKYVPYKFMNSIEREGKCGFIFHCRTSDHYRGKGIYSKALRMICDEYGSSFDNIIITAGSHNTASKRGILKSGFVRRMSINSIKLFNYEKAWPNNSKSN
jgi:predicted acetyltransferase